MNNQAYPWKVILPLSFVIIIDLIGLTIVFPIFSEIFSDHSPVFFSMQDSMIKKDLYFSLAITIYPLMTLFGAPLLGDMSDSIGRKKVLLICLSGSFSGLLLSGIAIQLHAFWLLLVGRAIAGFTAGSQQTAQAAIIDVSEKKNTTKNMALIILSITVGMSIGPILGGVLVDHKLVHFFNNTTPFWVASLLSLINIAWLVFNFKETYQAEPKKLSLLRGIKSLPVGFKQEKLRALSCYFLLTQLGWIMYYQVISFFLSKQFSYNALQSGFFMMYIALLLCFALSYVVKMVEKYISLSTFFKLSTLFVVVSYLIMALGYKNLAIMWLFSIPVALTIPVLYTYCLTLFSSAVDEQSQGWIMGYTGSINSLTMVIAAGLSGYLSYLHLNVPFYFSAGCMVGALIVLVLSKQILMNTIDKSPRT